MSPKGIPSYRIPFTGTNHMVSSGHYLATMSGSKILEEGGNAIDAGVASGIALNVTVPHYTNFGGVAPILIYHAASGEVVSISGLGRWPKAFNLEDYRKKYDNDMPAGIPRSVVPSACDAWLTALEHYGTMTFEQVVAPSIELAGNGFPTSYLLSMHAHASQKYIGQFQSSAEIFMPGGKPLHQGQVVVQRDLANVFRQMVDVEKANSHKGREGAIRAARDYFYKGDVAEKMGQFSQEQDGLITYDDIAQFSVEIEKPQVGTYKDYTLYTCGPWCQGPTLIEILQILEGFDLKSMGHNSAQYVHTVIEAINLGFADRHNYYGDPDFVEVPLAGLLSRGYAADRRNAIDPNKAWPEMPPEGDPWPYEGKVRTRGHVPAIPRTAAAEPDTSYTCVVDRWGNAFSATPSDFITSSPIVPGLGMIISSRGSQSWLDPEYPSCVEPWKRPRLTPNPAMALKNGHLFMPFGTPGGDAQVQSMVQMFLNMVEFGFDTQQAIEEPRARSTSFPSSFWPHAYYPGRLSIEGRFSEEVAAGLDKMGHKVDWLPDWTTATGGMSGIMVDRERGILIGGADPRRDNYAMGW
ncbi:MAG: gamma-glutamyltransferase family protein [Dehalococcoidia bacterium]|nr:gamma-glutamyltransferase family protein [Dehalococcoidia bacterium]